MLSQMNPGLVPITLNPYRQAGVKCSLRQKKNDMREKKKCSRVITPVHNFKKKTVSK